MKKLSVCLSMLLSLSLVVACTAVEPDPYGTASQPTIFGDFDIQQIDASTQDAVVLRLLNASAAMFDERAGRLTQTGSGWVIDSSPTLDDDGRVCTGDGMYPFRNEPAVASCSGYVVGPDLIATAGHCIHNRKTCRNSTFVFDFSVRNADANGVIRVDDDDVYACQQVVDAVAGNNEDWAVVRVDRDIVGHDPLPIRRSGRVEDDPDVDDIAIIGHPWGIPAKYANNATAYYGSSVWFEANLDHFGGNSGSLVASLREGEIYLVEGTLVWGPTNDWGVGSDSQGTCYYSYTCGDGGCPESFPLAGITRTEAFESIVPVIPADPFCGDNACDGTEDCATCSADCGACQSCGDGSCNNGEDCASCALDCGACAFCGDGTCDNNETCDSCSDDCGDCPVCEPRKGPCDSNDDCCSNRCHRRRGTCR